MTTVGIIGVGLLGTAIAGRLLRSGFEVIGFDVEPERRQHLSQLGGRAVDSAGEVASACRRVILSLPHSGISASVIDDIAGRLSPAAIVIDTTTGDPDDAIRFESRLAACGAAYLDSTVAGSSRQAHDGDVVVMVGGDRQAFESCRDIYDAIARHSAYLGRCGSGARMKLVVNLVLGLNRAVLAEGLAFARSLGFELSDVLSLLKSTAAYSRAMDVKGEKMIAGDFSPEARLSQHLKDVHLILQTASQQGLPLPLSQLHEALLSNLEAAGCGGEDNSAIFKAFDPTPPAIGAPARAPSPRSDTSG